MYALSTVVQTACAAASLHHLEQVSGHGNYTQLRKNGVQTQQQDALSAKHKNRVQNVNCTHKYKIETQQKDVLDEEHIIFENYCLEHTLPLEIQCRVYRVKKFPVSVMNGILDFVKSSGNAHSIMALWRLCVDASPRN